MQPDPGEGLAPWRGGENAAQGARGVGRRGDPRTPRGAGRVKDIGLFVKEIGAIDKSDIICILKVIWGCSGQTGLNVIRVTYYRPLRDQDGPARLLTAEGKQEDGIKSMWELEA